MGSKRREYRDEEGQKLKFKIKIDGKLIEREFRNKGDSIKYVKDHYEFTNEEIKRRVRFC